MRVNSRMSAAFAARSSLTAGLLAGVRFVELQAADAIAAETANAIRLDPRRRGKLVVEFHNGGHRGWRPAPRWRAGRLVCSGRLRAAVDFEESQRRQHRRGAGVASGVEPRELL